MMDLQIRQVEFASVRAAVTEHLAALSPPVDSFLEDHILESSHYQLLIDGAVAGFAAIHAGSLITQFHLDEPYRRYGQPVFQRVRRLEKVQAAFVPTSDEFLLAHALDDYRTLEKQAYFFALAPSAPASASPAAYAYRTAEPSDEALIQQHSEAFFEPLAARIQAGEIVIGYRGTDCVGFGIMARSTFYPDVASIGMFTVEAARLGGVGAATIRFLIARCQSSGLRPVAGCWYYNHNSKKTLERAGMFSQTRLLKLGY
jgi:GNAT superfamily N-acetyltransferase